VLCIDIGNVRGSLTCKSRRIGLVVQVTQSSLICGGRRLEMSRQRLVFTAVGAIENCTIHILHNTDSVDAFIAGKVEEKSAQFAKHLGAPENCALLPSGRISLRT